MSTKRGGGPMSCACSSSRCIVRRLAPAASRAASGAEPGLSTRASAVTSPAAKPDRVWRLSRVACSTCCVPHSVQRHCTDKPANLLSHLPTYAFGKGWLYTRYPPPALYALPGAAMFRALRGFCAGPAQQRRRWSQHPAAAASHCTWLCAGVQWVSESSPKAWAHAQHDHVHHAESLPQTL